LASSTPATSLKVTAGLSPLSNRARLRPNEIAWLLPLCVWRSMYHMNPPITRKRMTFGRMTDNSRFDELGGSVLKLTLSSSNLASIW
jgi:hypothetical protein